MNKINQFIQLVGKNGNLQKKYLFNAIEKLSNEENKSLNNIIAFYENEGYSLEFQAKAYLLFVNDTLEETKFFVENERYRYSKFDEVASNVYFDHEYMTKYMVGLGLSIYLWNQHKDTIGLFEKLITNCKGEHYLEIGPGHGEYFLKAIEKSQINHYMAVDISQTSIDLTKRYVEYSFWDRDKDIEYICMDFLNANLSKKFDIITMCEVLEHVEEPKKLLQKMKACFSGKGFCFISVPINAPTKDHIYLFRNSQEVLTMVKEVGFDIVEYHCFYANNRTIEKAIKNKEAILMALILK